MRSVVIVVCAASFASPWLSAQQVLRTIAAPTDAYEFGWAVAGGADVDGDGYDDVVIGCPNSPSILSSGGRVDVHSGATGAPLHQWGSGGAADRYGTSVRYCGDVDGDGFVDVVIGAPQFSFANASQGGFVEVRSGASGAILRQVTGNVGDFAGWSVDGGHDVDLDGTPDFVFGAPQQQIGSNAPGYVRVVSGATGTTSVQRVGPIAKGQFGSVVRFLGDATGDGIPEFAVSAANAGFAPTFGGRILVYSASDGSLLWQFVGTTSDERVAASIAAPSDLDGDGLADVVFGSPGFDLAAEDLGNVTAARGNSGASLWSRTGAAAGFGLGGSAAAAGDLDGDGVGDVLVANQPSQPFATQIQVLSGANGAALAALSDPYLASGFGQALDGAGDVNGDGSIELVVGAPAEGGPALPIGAVGLVTFQCGIAVSLGAPCNPAAPHPSLTLDGCAVGAAAMTLSLTSGVPQAPTIVCASVNPVQVAVGGGCSWFVGVPFVAVGPFPLTPSGSFSAAVDLPAQAQQLTFIMQAAIADPTAATGFALSDAVFVALP